MKKVDGHTKGILRKASKEVLPDDVLYRLKVAYPNCENPEFDTFMKALLKPIIEDATAPVWKVYDRDTAQKILTSDRENLKEIMNDPLINNTCGEPLAEMYCMNYWLKKYNVELNF